MSDLGRIEATPADEERRRQLSPEVQREIHAATRRAMIEVLEEYSRGSCPGRLSPEALDEASHFFGTLKDAGDGDHAKGIEGIRSVLNGFKSLSPDGDSVSCGVDQMKDVVNAFKSAGGGNVHTGVDIFKRSMRVLARVEGIGGKLTMAFFVGVFTLVAGGVVSALILGIRAMLFNNGAGK